MEECTLGVLGIAYGGKVKRLRSSSHSLIPPFINRQDRAHWVLDTLLSTGHTEGTQQLPWQAHSGEVEMTKMSRENAVSVRARGPSPGLSCLLAEGQKMTSKER